MDDTRLIKHVVFAKMGGKSRRGRPCREWLDDITEWCQRSGQDLFSYCARPTGVEKSDLVNG